MDGICLACGAKGAFGDSCGKHSCRKSGQCFVPEEFAATRPSFSFSDGDSFVGRKVDDYLLVKWLAEGGFGVVYLALQLPLGMKTALKFLKLAGQSEETTRLMASKFELEARALAELSHPNIVRLIKYGSIDGAPYMIMEFVEGARSLKEAIREGLGRAPVLPLDGLRTIMVQLLRALRAAHSRNIIHRDIKPGNIMLQPVEGDENFVRLLDFGIASLQRETDQTTGVLGTPAYMAPEQFSGKGIGPWTDLYAVGLILYELFTGKLSFGQTDYHALCQAKFGGVETIFESHELPEPLRDFLLSACATDPDRRIQTAVDFETEMLRVFDRLEAQSVASSSPISASEIWAGDDVFAETVDSEEHLEQGQEGEASAIAGSQATSAGKSKSRMWALVVATTLVAATVTGVFLNSLRTDQSGDLAITVPAQGAAYHPDVAGLAGGGYAVAYAASTSAPSSTDIHLLQLDASGAPLGDALVVNTHVSGEQTAPRIASFADGSLIVVWVSDGQDGDGWGVYGQRFDAQGGRIRSEFLVNTNYISGAQSMPAIAVASNDEHVIVWQSYKQDGDDFGIFAQPFHKDGLRNGDAIQVNALGAGRQRYPALSPWSEGSFAVVWENEGEFDGDDFGIVLQRLSGTGPVGPPIRVNSHVAGRQRYPVVSHGDDDTLAILWTSEDQDGDGRGVFGQLLAGDGTLLGQEFRLNSESRGNQWLPVLKAVPGRGYCAVWLGDSEAGMGTDVFARTFDGAGQLGRVEERINRSVTGDQTPRALAVGDSGQVLVAWEGPGPGGAASVISGHLANWEDLQ